MILRAARNKACPTTVYLSFFCDSRECGWIYIYGGYLRMAKELVKIEGKSKETIERRFSSTFNLVKVRIRSRKKIDQSLLIVVVIGSFSCR